MTRDIVVVTATGIRVGDFCQSGEPITKVECGPDGVTVTWEQSNTIPADACLYVIRDMEAGQ